MQILAENLDLLPEDAELKTSTWASDGVNSKLVSNLSSAGSSFKISAVEEKIESVKWLSVENQQDKM